jgi:hypothetical protein
MIRVGHRLVPAAGSMTMAAVMGSAGVLGGTGVGMVGARGEVVLVDVVTMDVMEMPLVQVVGVTLVGHDLVAAAWAMGVGIVILVFCAAHRSPSLRLARRDRC